MDLCVWTGYCEAAYEHLMRMHETVVVVQSVCCLCLSVFLSVRHYISQSVRLSVCPSVSPSVCLSIHLFARLSLRQSV